jgi:hypothetical protein
MAEGLGAEEIKGVVETGAYAAEAVADAMHGEWDKAADSALSMSESALGVATAGISTAVESGLDGLANEVGLSSTHDAINAGLHAVGDALGDGLSDLVGTDQSVQALHSFDQGDILGGIGHMAEGTSDTIGGAVSQGLSDIGDALGLGSASDGGQADGGPMSDPSGGGQPPDDGGANIEVPADGG